MARRSRMSVLKRQRELKKAEKAAHKRAKRHGLPISVAPEPIPTIRVGDLIGAPADEDASDETEDSAPEPDGEDRTES